MNKFTKYFFDLKKNKTYYIRVHLNQGLGDAFILLKYAKVVGNEKLKWEEIDFVPEGSFFPLLPQTISSKTVKVPIKAPVKNIPININDKRLKAQSILNHIKKKKTMAQIIRFSDKNNCSNSKT